MAIKVENLPQARPQSGIQAADLVFEEPVEAGITRFVVVYQCAGSSHVEPVRSARLIDPLILGQLGRVIFGFAGGIGPTLNAVRAANVFDADFTRYPLLYLRDPYRYPPHNLYVSTYGLWQLDPADRTPPRPLFSYSARPLPGAPANVAHVPFSSYSDVYWRYNRTTGTYDRYYGSQPALSASGTPISAANVVIQKAQESVTPYVEDANGVHEVMLALVGSGPVTVLRNGVAITGTWRRASISSRTRFYDHSGKLIGLAPGKTWIELVPSTVPVTFGP
ncbi:MAG: DUF3048 domain-containing protein [Actinomycetota bacterium]|nr:DUF3048 domain-containing protein [Actinomycetota bacterium]